MQVPSGFMVLLLSIVAAVGNELVSWLLVYRTEKYRRLKTSLLQSEKKLESLKAASTKAKSKKKKEERTESSMKANMMLLQKTRTVTTIVTGVLMFLFYQILQRQFKGIPVARLPFEPPLLLKFLSHRGLPEGSDPADVSVSFLYLLCQLTLRAVVGKMFNFGVRKSLQQSLANPNNPLPGILPDVPKAD